MRLHNDMTQSIAHSARPRFTPPAASSLPAWARLPARADIINVLLLVAAVWLWALPLAGIDVRRMDDTGLISVLPPRVLGGLLLLCASFSWAICRRPLPVWLVPVHLALLIYMTYGLTAILYDAPRFAIGWKLAGIMDYIMQTGTVDGRIDAFFNWPGFFILMAFFTQISGFDTPDIFMTWAPVIFNLLYLGPLWLLFRSATTDLRLVFAGMWLYYLANWIGQDYLAPQAINYFFYLTVLAILLTWLRGAAWRPKDLLARLRPLRVPGAARLRPVWNWLARHSAGVEQPATPSTPAQRAALLAVTLLILAAMVTSHQLTPFATLAAISVLVLFNRCTVLTLPLILGTMTATWIVYAASPYVHGHIEHITGPVGLVATNIDANLTERFRGSPDHLLINYLRAGMSLGIWVWALAGGIRRVRSGPRDVALALLACAPFPLLLLQAYGGELLLRIYLYSVPFMAFFCAALFFPSPAAGRSWRTLVSLGLVSAVTLVGFLFTRYGNERMMYFTSEEVVAVHRLYALAEPGAQLVAATGTLPWRFQDYRALKYTTVPSLVRTGDVDALAEIMANKRYPASYLILSRSQQASGELFIGWSPGTWEKFVQLLHDSDKFALIYANDAAEIFGLRAGCRQDAGGRYTCASPVSGGQ